MVIVSPVGFDVASRFRLQPQGLRLAENYPNRGWFCSHLPRAVAASRWLFTGTFKPRMPFAQLVIGPPGSGKSTYCDGMHQFLSAIGRKCSVVNLDPANDSTSYPCALDVRKLVTLEEIMDDDELGPNGAVLYALEELEHNWEWLEQGLKGLGGRIAGCGSPGDTARLTAWL